MVVFFVFDGDFIYVGDGGFGFYVYNGVFRFMDGCVLVYTFVWSAGFFF